LSHYWVRQKLFQGPPVSRETGAGTAITDYERSIRALTLIFEAFDRPGSVSRETDRRPQAHATKRIAK
jgi:hypothetical protein